MQRADFISGLFLFGLSILICYGALRLEVGTPQSPAPGFFPFVSGLAVGVLSVLIWTKGRKKQAVENRFWLPQADKKGIVLAFGLLLFYAFFLEILGFLVTNVLFFLLITKFVSHLRWAKAFVFTALCTIGIQLVFKTLFNTPLPAGIFKTLIF
jgi:putative tricarboxylic transport membrane protein